MTADSENEGTYKEEMSVPYTFDENTNTATLILGESSTFPVKFVVTEHNKAVLIVGSGTELCTTNGWADVEGATTQMLGTYLGENSEQLQVTNDSTGEHVVGIISNGDEINIEFYTINGEIASVEDKLISFAQDGNDYVLAIDEDTYIKQ